MNSDSYFGVKPPDGVGALPARQGRSRVTAERFVEAALELLQTRTFDELSVADIARAAGRSVGAFYQRFGSKDDFLAVLIVAHLEAGVRSTRAILASARDEGVVDEVLTGIFDRLVRNRNLWHAALRKSAQDPAFWTPLRAFVQSWPQAMADRLGELRGRPLGEEERRRLAVAVQVFNSVINNQMTNNPGPLTLSSPDFLPSLLKIFHAVHALDL